MMWDGNGWHDGGWGFGGWATMIGIVLLAVAVTLLVVYLLRNAAGGLQAPAGTANGRQTGEASPAQPARGGSPREIVQRRYAAGEIDREEYLLKLRDLTG